MIDLVYRTLQTIINKDNNGYVSPTEFNTLCNLVQMEIFRGYFEEENRDKNKENRGLTNKGYSNLDFNQRQMITQFAEIQDLTKVDSKFQLPANLYFIEDDGVTIKTDGKVIEEVERSKINYIIKSKAYDSTFPVYENYNGYIVVYPQDISEITVRYLRTPKMPKWTYMEISGKELFDPSNSSYQDFEIHDSEFSNIVVRLLSYFSINIREKEVLEIAERLKNEITVKDNN